MFQSKSKPYFLVYVEQDFRAVSFVRSFKQIIVNDHSFIMMLKRYWSLLDAILIKYFTNA